MSSTGTVNGKHMEIALFIVGEPGCGKTTLVRRILGMSPNGELPAGGYLVPKPKWTLVPTGPFFNVAAAGHYTGGTFDGGDMVPYNGVTQALNYIIPRIDELGMLIFDGDRFSNASTLAALRLAGMLDFRCVHLSLPEEVAAARRAERGSNQNLSWVKGRKTKSRRFAETFESRLFLDATETTDEMKQRVQEFLG